MRMAFTIVASDGETLPSGSTLKVELRDTSFEDAPAVVLQQLQVRVPDNATSIPVAMEVDGPTDGLSVWVHVDCDGSGRLSAGDYVSMESYPLRAEGAPSMQLRVRRIE